MALVAVVGRKINPQALVHFAQIGRQLEDETKLFGNLVADVAKDVERKIVLLGCDVGTVGKFG